jgi:hypothetical protein
MELHSSRELFETSFCYYYERLRRLEQRFISQQALTGRVEVYTKEDNHI